MFRPVAELTVPTGLTGALSVGEGRLKFLRRPSKVKRKSFDGVGASSGVGGKLAAHVMDGSFHTPKVNHLTR